MNNAEQVIYRKYEKQMKKKRNIPMRGKKA